MTTIATAPGPVEPVVDDAADLASSTSKIKRPKGLLFPAVAFLVVVTQVPFVVTVFFAFRSWNLLRPQDGQHWVGVQNFLDLAHAEPSLLRTVGQTIVLTVVTVAVSTLIGLGLVLLIRAPFPGRGVVRTVLITPMLVMPVVTGILWKKLVLDTGSGILPWIARQLGDTGFAPLSEHPMPAVIIMSVWMWAPFAMVILMSGLSSLDPATEEAAQMDGVGAWSNFRYIVLPHLSSYLAITVLLGLILVLPTFGVIYVTTAGGPGYATTNLAYAVYQQAFANYSIGAASALALTDTVFVIFALTGLMKIIGKTIVRGEVIE
ncbi:sugar ABC transporter permease [Micromonospora sp. NPDC005206]|uniref:carbohydrate ABC transporter permease n=1 Tax=Micromonospora sp. NPDC005206 TaxID=3157022 RepID=UPI0033BA63FD